MDATPLSPGLHARNPLTTGIEEYPTFTEFFTRRLKPGMRPIAPGELLPVSPVDGTVGELGDIVFIELPKVGAKFKKHDVFGTIEAVKAVSELFAPVSGEIVAVNDRLDAERCQQMYDGMQPMDEVLRSSGQYGPRVPVPDDADAQTKLLGFIGRDPAWTAA